MESEACDERSKRKKVSEIPSTSSEDSMPILPEELIAAILSLFHDDSVTEAFDLDCPMKNPRLRVKITGSVNGLICLSNGFRGLVIWNPSTREFTEVFNFVPPQMPHCWCRCGFGYDKVHDDYKVVGIFSRMIKEKEAMIYSLKSDSMKTLEGFKPGVSYYDSTKFVDRKLHWITEHRLVGCITCIDLVDEKWGKVELPCCCEEEDLMLGVLGSDLSLLRTPDHSTHADVWVMEYGVKKSWTKLYTIRCPRVL